MRHKTVSFTAIGVCLFLISVSHAHAAYDYFLPAFKSQPDYWSGLGITNLRSSVPANITVTVYNKSGTAWATETKTVPAGGQDSFVVGGGSISEGWIKITSDQRLAGMNLLGEYIKGTTDYYLADVSFTEIASKFLLIPHVAQNPKWDTTVYIANTESSAGSITLTYINKSGGARTPYVITIPGNGSLEIPVSTIGNSTAIYGGYVTINSDRKLTAFALYNNLKTGNYSYAGINAVDYTHNNCGAYIAPGIWRQFDCYNLAAVGKTTNDDPFVPSWRLIGGYWQWGRKGPHSSQWYKTNTSNFAHGSTGPGSSEANSDVISGWSQTDAPDGSWSDASKTANDPCPTGFRIPTKTQWAGVRANNTQTTLGTWPNSATNYSSARFFGNALMLPAAGYRTSTDGALNHRGGYGTYWSSSQATSGNAWGLYFYSSTADSNNYYRSYGRSVRCVAE